MYLLTGGKWQPGYYDYEIFQEDQVKIAVKEWFLLGKVADQYISYPNDWKILYNYLMDVGPRAVFLKLMSRLREKNRNAKFYSLGKGIVTQVGNTSYFALGEQVIFFAPNHPKCVSSIVLNKCLVANAPGQPAVNSNEVRFYQTSNLTLPEILNKHAGWSPFSGTDIREDELKAALAQCNKLLETITKTAPTKKLAIDSESKPTTTAAPTTKLMQAALFGLGNYAKVFIIPNLDKRITISAVHEIDPAQIGLKKWGSGSMSTSPLPNSEKNFAVYFAAGYHHTHADIAIHALKQGAAAVVEKPVATTEKQLHTISELLSNSKGRFFACFHKRYSILNDWVYQDLGHEPGTAIDYHCVVYEIPLPPGHWYNWQTSGSRIVSNGCHWIDHFMFLNEYSPAVTHSIVRARRGHINVHIELENGAVFSMFLTDIGSPRLGVRDYIELRQGQTTITMTDSSHYRSENIRGCIRKKTVNKIDAYRRMYATISTMIADQKNGDSVASLRSSQLVIELNKLLPTEK